MSDKTIDGESSLQTTATPTSEELGTRIRRMRTESGWTLQELAERAGVSLSTLSKIENAQVAPTFDTLVKTAQGLGIRFESLLSGPGVPAAATPADAPAQRRPVGGRLMVTRADAGVEFSTPMYEYRVHANGLRRKFMTPLIMEVKARSATDVTAWSSHEGEEFILVLSGVIELHTEFYDPVTLATGDSAYIDSGMSHMFLCVGEAPASMASICYSDAIDQPEVMITLPTISV